MKKYALVLAASVLMMCTTLMAQDQNPAPGKRNAEMREMKTMKRSERPLMSAGMRAEKLAMDLNLTDAETAKVKALFQKQDAEMAKRRAELEKKMTELRAKFEADRKAQDAELEKIIGKEKFRKLDSLRADRKEMRQEKMMKNRRMMRNGRFQERRHQGEWQQNDSTLRNKQAQPNL